MRSRRVKIVGVLTGFLVAGMLMGYLGMILSQQRALSLVEQTFTEMGLSEKIPQPSQSAFGTILFENFIFDKEGLSSADQVFVRYGIDVLWTGTLNSLVISSPEFYGEVSDAGAVSIAGLEAPFAIKWSDLPVRNLRWRDARFALLLPGLGGIGLNLDLNVRQQPSADQTDVLGTLKTRQKTLAFDANLNSVATRHDTWQGEIEMNRGRLRLDDPPVEIGRANAVLSFVRSPASRHLDVQGQIQTGKFMLWGSNWDLATISFEYGERLAKAYIDAKSAHPHEVEMSLTWEDGTLNGVLYAPDKNSLASFLENEASLPPALASRLNSLKNADDIQLGFVVRYPAGRQIGWHIVSGDKTIDEKGTWDPDNQSP